MAPLHPFWGAVFDGHRNTLIVPGDVGLAMQTGLTHQGITLPIYASGTYRSAQALQKDSIEEIAHRLGRRRYITLGDMQFGQWLIQQPEASHGHPVLSYARDLKQEDIQNSNLILLGSKPVNPWVGFFADHLDFVIEHNYITGEETVYNQRPKNREPSSYFFSGIGRLSSLYCSIAFERGNADHGSRLIIQGTTMAGNQLCFNLLMDNPRWNSILASVKNKNNFEILFRSGSTSLDTAQAVILAVHTH